MAGKMCLILMFLFTGISCDPQNHTPCTAAHEDWQIQTVFFFLGLLMLMCIIALVLISAIMLPVALRMRMPPFGNKKAPACVDAGTATLCISKIKDFWKDVKYGKGEGFKKDAKNGKCAKGVVTKKKIGNIQGADSKKQTGNTKGNVGTTCVCICTTKDFRKDAKNGKGGKCEYSKQ